VTPNHHALAARFAMSDNFYADSEVSVDGHHWLVGSYPNAWTESSLMAAYGGAKEFRFPTSAPGRLSFADRTRRCIPRSNWRRAPSGIIWNGTYCVSQYGEGFELAGVAEEPGEKPYGPRFVTQCADARSAISAHGARLPAVQT